MAVMSACKGLAPLLFGIAGTTTSLIYTINFYQLGTGSTLDLYIHDKKWLLLEAVFSVLLAVLARFQPIIVARSASERGHRLSGPSSFKQLWTIIVRTWKPRTKSQDKTLEVAHDNTDDEDRTLNGGSITTLRVVSEKETV